MVKKCLTPLRWSDPFNLVLATKDMLEEMDNQVKVRRHNLKATSVRPKSYVNLKRSVRKFEEGDMVFIRMRPRMSSIILRNFKKLALRYCGLYVIVRRIGDLAYELLLLLNSKYIMCFMSVY